MKEPKFGTISHGKRRKGFQQKNHFGFGDRKLKNVVVVDKMESVCGVKAFINHDQMIRKMKACWRCGLYHERKERVQSQFKIDAMGVNLTQERGVEGGVLHG